MERGKEKLVHLAWVMGILAAESNVYFSSQKAHPCRALGQGRACLAVLQDAAQVLSTGLGKWGEQSEKGGETDVSINCREASHLETVTGLH